LVPKSSARNVYVLISKLVGLDLERKSLDMLAADVGAIARDYASCDIVMADVESITPDQRVRDFLEIVDRISLEVGCEAG
jgi:hypothetical protein